uniref:Lipase n=1 Tax=Terrapene triunguis TaxID=2587831 RepID=A0A674KG24_9SAUR
YTDFKIYESTACYCPETFRSVNNSRKHLFCFLQSEIIRYRGYLSEEYEIMTDDSYYLSINRIPFCIGNGTGETSSGILCLNPVLLQHGLVLEGTTWVANMANSSLGFILADSGYDVWIGNNRGNNYWARKHYNLTADQEEFSDNRYLKINGRETFKILLFYILKTGQVQLYYIGYSQGTTLGFVAFSSMPELAQKIKMFFALAPIITLKHSKSPLVKLFFIPEGINNFSVKGEILSKFTVQVCRYRVFQKLCSLVFSVIGGFNEKNLNIVYIKPQMNILCLKLTTSQAFTFKAVQFVFQTEAPLYTLEDMKVPTALWYGGEDWLVNLEDIKILLPQITNLQYEKYIPDWAHFDFIWGLDAPERVYSEIIDLMKNHP